MLLNYSYFRILGKPQNPEFRHNPEINYILKLAVTKNNHQQISEFISFYFLMKSNTHHLRSAIIQYEIKLYHNDKTHVKSINVSSIHLKNSS